MNTQLKRNGFIRLWPLFCLQWWTHGELLIRLTFLGTTIAFDSRFLRSRQHWNIYAGIYTVPCR